MDVDPQFNASAQVLCVKDDAVARDALEQHHQIEGARESAPAERQRGEEIATM